MKPKLILCLALVLSGGLLLALFLNAAFTDGLLKREGQQPAVVRTKVTEGERAKKLKTPWTDTKVVLYRASGEVETLDARSAIYAVISTHVSTNQHKPFDVPAMAFIDPKTQKVWIGWAASGVVNTNEFENADHTISTNYFAYTNLFIETGSEIIKGDNLLHDGAFEWQESVIKQVPPGESLDAMISRLENGSSKAWLLGPTCGTSSLDGYFQRDFFSSGNLGSQTTPIQRIEVSNGRLRLDFNSLQYRTNASVWLELKTMKVLKAFEYK